LVVGIATLAIAAGYSLNLYHREVAIALMTRVVRAKHLSMGITSPLAVVYFPLKLFLAGVIAFAVPLVTAWVQTSNWPKYIATAATLLALSCAFSVGGVFAYRCYVQTEVNNVHIGGVVYPSLARGDITPIDAVPIISFALLGPCLVLAGVAFRRRSVLFPQQ
jgi:hypothetical protein